MDFKKYAHIITTDKFMTPFIEFVEKNFNIKEHIFYVVKDLKMYDFDYRKDCVIRVDSNIKWIKMYRDLYKFDKIIIHGLWKDKYNILSSFQPWLQKKSYWIIWGGDLYWYKFRKRNLKTNFYEFFRRIIIKNIKYIVTGNQGDYKLAQKWYKAKGARVDSFAYPSNLFQPRKLYRKKDKIIRILLGNSASFTNNHKEILEKLEKYKSKNMLIYAPLSYSSKGNYRDSIISLGLEKFNNKFIPLVKFIKYDEYLKILNNIDIAIFNHKNQAAFGTTVSLLGMGKKVYISKRSNLWEYFNDLEIKIFANDNISLEPMSYEDINNNIKIIKIFFSEENLVNSYKKIFNIGEI